MQVLEIIKVILTGAIGIIVAWFFKWFRTWCKGKYEHFKKNRDQWRLLQEAILKDVIDQLKEIKGQVLPNGGSSMNDKVGRIDTHIKVIDKTLADLKTEQWNFLEIQDIAVWRSDKNGRVTYVSSAFCEIIGCSNKDLMDSSWVGFVVPEDRKRVLEDWTESVRTASEYNCTYHYRKTDGTLQKVRAVAIHNKDEHGNVVNTLGRVIVI